MKIMLYTDGACKGNPGNGGWACILYAMLPNGQPYQRPHSAGYRMTTNNRMELLGVIEGLRFINGVGHEIEVISDSKYVCDAFNKGWIFNWQKKGWMKKVKGDLPNADLWSELWCEVNKHKEVKFVWIKGHNGHPFNEECDRMAVASALDKNNWYIDMGYESQRYV